ncbi:hypothetical protein J437_LFUL001838, partial [Ladona fulva]
MNMSTVLKDYNFMMGGVDQVDQHISDYLIIRKRVCKVSTTRLNINIRPFWHICKTFQIMFLPQPRRVIQLQFVLCVQIKDIQNAKKTPCIKRWRLGSGGRRSWMAASSFKRDKDTSTGMSGIVVMTQ